MNSGKIKHAKNHRWGKTHCPCVQGPLQEIGATADRKGGTFNKSQSRSKNILRDLYDK